MGRVCGREATFSFMRCSITMRRRDHSPSRHSASSCSDGRKANSIPGKEISEMLREAGFGNIQVKPTFGYWGIVTAQKL